ncbi:putative protein N(5)-glutamine methyltransferase [Demequina sp. SYSU T00039]|uniref:Methyltransferase small domain-containing protein n=1 Tax=Demequina lignilytica TaxID=3051663 RepID=A0AAW7M0L4_9MICO|nr:MULTISPECIES: putative protein N(5)-glutamine methyltransferase [unclassified Demequina]MDN4477949.1 putative protein N(5)-glutamine methyltransferase [Demequina sp. SYSU T00039-1]MDN4487858.1 putative protein N(5)-glutamine methyltransferase [Demequina sp. SYSU T00039]MDN4490759.1 putative protein N(5)-glutamine methyltransferase [Demequina sp. SYSU T00068]
MDDAMVTRLRAAGCVFAEEEAALLAAAGGDRDALVARRERGEPLELVLGWALFAGLRVPVAPGVFVPRRRTELVAEVALALAPAGGTMVDLCCGAGAIGGAVAYARPDLTVVAADIDPAAVDLAHALLAPLGATAIASDLDDALAHLRGLVDVVTACPPYVPTAQIPLMPREARDHEPVLALDGGPDGLDLQRGVFAASSRLLRPGGACVVETSDALERLTVAAAAGAGLVPALERDDERGAVVVVARQAGASTSSSSRA